MTGAVQLFIDIVNRRLAFSFLNAATINLPPFVQGETLPLQLYFLKPIQGAENPFEYVDFSGSTIKVGITNFEGQPHGQLPHTVIAFQDTFSAIPNGFSGLLSLNTAGIETFLTDFAVRDSTFEVEVTEPASFPVKYLQVPVTLKSEVIDGAASVPVPTSDYMTRNESNAAFVKKIGLPGETVQFTSPNGVWGRILGVRDDGSAQDDIIEL